MEGDGSKDSSDPGQWPVMKKKTVKKKKRAQGGKLYEHNTQ